MRPDLFETVRNVFERACELADEERERYLQEACGADHELRRQVERLLSHDSDYHPGLEKPAVTPFVDGADDKRVPERIGSYEIIRVLGVGGMGIVYEAHQPSLGRPVALKVLRRIFESSDIRRRFEREGRALGRLHHPGIATVYEAGTADIDGSEHAFLAMERIEGVSLDQYVRVGKLSTDQVVALVARIGDAIQHAHDQDVVHRDLKPANILVETDGSPRILDFGIAHLTDADLTLSTNQTRSGDLLGTLSYMSPEQVRGNPAKLDGRADVYALGCILTELLTGRTPQEVNQLPVVEAARVIVEDEPASLGSIDPQLTGDLETIVAKTLAKEPGRRYATVGELSADLRRFLASEPIHARPVSTMYQLRRYARRNRILLAGVASTMVALVIGLIGTVSFSLRAVDRARAAEAAERTADLRAEEADDAREEASLRAEEAESARIRSDQERQRAVATRNLLIEMLMTALPERSAGREPTVKEALANAVSWVLDRKVEDPEVEFHLCLNLATVQQAIGNFEEQEDLYLRATEVADEQLSHLPRLGSLARVRYAHFLRIHDRPEEGAEVWKEVVGSGELPEEVDDPALWIGLGDLGWERLRKGEFAEAVRFCELAVKNLDRLEATVNSRMWAYWQLSNAHMYLREDLEREVETAETAHALLEQAGGVPRVPNGLQVVLQLANALDDSGRHEEAIEVYRNLLEDTETWYTGPHKDKDLVRVNLGLALLNLEQFDEAIDLTLQAYDGYATRDPGTEDAGSALRMAMSAFVKSGRHEEGADWSAGLILPRLPIADREACHLLRGRMLSSLERHEEALSELLPNLDTAAARVSSGASFIVEAYKATVASLEALQDERVLRYRETLDRQSLAQADGSE